MRGLIVSTCIHGRLLKLRVADPYQVPLERLPVPRSPVTDLRRDNTEMMAFDERYLFCKFYRLLPYKARFASFCRK